MMSDNDIKKEFQSKFSGFEAPVPTGGWDSVECSLKAATAARTVFRRRWWYAGSAAAVLILLVCSILFVQSPVEQAEIVVSESASPAPFADNSPYTDNGSDSVTEAEGGRESSSETVASPAGTGRLLAAKASGEESQVRPVAPGSMMTARVEREALQVKDTDRKMDAGALQRLVKSAAEAAEQSRKALPAGETIVIGEGEEILLAADAADTGERTLLLAFNGKGGLTGYQQTVNLPMTLRAASAVPDGKYPLESYTVQAQAKNTAENTSQIEHDQPVSFGITVSKYLFDDLSVETGLVYSYLRSKTRNANNNFKVEEVQKLHYLGIPVNVNYNLFSFRGLNIYASVGGMIEKDIYGEFRRVMEGQTVNLNNEASDESKENEVTKVSQRNPQLSVNVGLGLSYPLYDRLRLYGKIGGAYYFDAKNEYKNIYSDRQIVMDLNLGLRYEF